MRVLYCCLSVKKGQAKKKKKKVAIFPINPGAATAFTIQPFVSSWQRDREREGEYIKLKKKHEKGEWNSRKHGPAVQDAKQAPMKMLSRHLHGSTV
ncbi:hypothetical protein ACLOJK_026878 [Asimina triloba]